MSSDGAHATAAALPVSALHSTLAVVTAVTVVVSMRVVGLLLISALMIVPVATAQLLAGSFRATMRLGSLVGTVSAVGAGGMGMPK